MSGATRTTAAASPGTPATSATGETGATPSGRGRGPRRTLVLAGIALAILIATLVALPVRWALTARPAAVVDPAVTLHAVATQWRDPATDAVPPGAPGTPAAGATAASTSGPAAWEAMLAIRTELERMRAEVAAAEVPPGFAFRVGPPPLAAAAASAGRPLAERAETWPQDQPLDEVRVAFAVADGLLARVQASDLVARAAAIARPTVTVDALRAMGIGRTSLAAVRYDDALGMRRVADAALATGLAAVAAGDREGAFTALEAMRAAAETADAVPVLITTLVGVAIRGQLLDLAGTMLLEADLAAADLDRLDDVLRRTGPGHVRRGLEGERTMLMGLVSAMYDGHGRLLLAELPRAIDPSAPAPTGLARLANLQGLLAPRRGDLERRIDAAHAWPVRNAGGVAEDEPSAGSGAPALVLPGSIPTLLVEMLLPAVDRAAERQLRSHARWNATRLAVAMARHRAETGRWPRTLDEVALPAGGDALVVDPRTGTPFGLTTDPAAGDEGTAGPPSSPDLARPRVRSAGGIEPVVVAPSPHRWRAPQRSADD